jgi:hypothetical protein
MTVVAVTYDGPVNEEEISGYITVGDNTYRKGVPKVVPKDATTELEKVEGHKFSVADASEEQQAQAQAAADALVPPGDAQAAQDAQGDAGAGDAASGDPEPSDDGKTDKPSGEKKRR